MATLPKNWTATALELTGHFEDDGEPWSAVSGNFDGMGVSLGVLQWNFGQGSLQPMVIAAGRPAVDATMPTIGAAFWQAAHAGPSGWLPIVAGWHTGIALKSVARQELRAFTGSPAFVAQQVAASEQTAQTAFEFAKDWAKSDPAFGAVSKALFCWFFDLTTQNGTLKGIGFAQLDTFRKSLSHPRDFVCDRLAGQPLSVAGAKDAHRNAELWRSAGTARGDDLLLLSYLRSLKSTPQWQTDVLNRKGTVAQGIGWVHGTRHDLTALLHD